MPTPLSIKPVPRPPRVAAEPTAEVVAPTPAVPVSDPAAFGRVDDDGTVYVRQAGSERAVGQWPAGQPDEALAFYGIRFDGLAVEVDLLCGRIEAGSLSPDEATSRVSKLQAQLAEAPAVGDLDGLAAKLEALAPTIAEQRKLRQAERQARIEAATASKEALVATAEKLAEGKDWRAGADRLRELLDEWKALPRLSKEADDALWHRFSVARTTYTKRRRQHFGDVSSQRDDARAAKQAIIAEAEAVKHSTDWGATTSVYRDLMTRWKAAGSAGREGDNALWRKFRAAQDTFFEARNAATEEQDEAFAANATVKRELLAEAEALLPIRDVKSARSAFRRLSERWEAAGKVPRGEIRDLDGRFGAVEQAIRSFEEEHWRRSDPAVLARVSETVTKLEASIAALRKDRDRAESAGNAKKVAEADAAIAARESWLEQARKSGS